VRPPPASPVGTALGYPPEMAWLRRRPCAVLSAAIGSAGGVGRVLMESVHASIQPPVRYPPWLRSQRCSRGSAGQRLDLELSRRCHGAKHQAAAQVSLQVEPQGAGSKGLLLHQRWEAVLPRRRRVRFLRMLSPEIGDLLGAPATWLGGASLSPLRGPLRPRPKHSLDPRL
jgi:hypothetical protein